MIYFLLNKEKRTCSSLFNITNVEKGRLPCDFYKKFIFLFLHEGLSEDFPLFAPKRMEVDLIWSQLWANLYRGQSVYLGSAEMSYSIVAYLISSIESLAGLLFIWKFCRNRNTQLMSDPRKSVNFSNFESSRQVATLGEVRNTNWTR